MLISMMAGITDYILQNLCFPFFPGTIGSLKTPLKRQPHPYKQDSSPHASDQQVLQLSTSVLPPQNARSGYIFVSLLFKFNST